MKKIGLVFSHCHWDIEWYMPFRSYRFWLMDVFDRLLAVTRRDPRFKTFVLDGQVAPLEHYLEVKPERRRVVHDLVRSGRLSIGPFYTQFDEWLISGESIIRNCLEGNRKGRAFGRIMQAGYLPDNFGHPRQMPQILAGFGIDNLIFGRGMPDRPRHVREEFYWRGLDGTKVLAVHLPFLYGNAACLGAPPATPFVLREGPYGETFVGYEWRLQRALHADVDAGASQLIEAARAIAKIYPSGVLPLANGTDHASPQAQIAEIIERANKIQDEFRFRHGNCEDLVKCVRKSGARFPTFAAELWGSRHQPIYPGTLATRVPIKQANFSAEALLEKYAEPLAVAATLHGWQYPTTLLREAWRLLFLNHAHDGIHGSSTDAVHREMIQRFDAVRQIAVGIGHAALKHLGRLAARKSDQRKLAILAYNPIAAGATPAIMSLWVHAKNNNFHVEDASGQALPTQVLERNLCPPRSKKRGFYSPWPSRASRQILFAASVQPQTLASFAIMPGQAVSDAYPAQKTMIENEFLRVVFRNHALDVFDKPSGAWYRRLNIIEDEADAGDAWDFSEPWKRNPICFSDRFPATCRLIDNGPVRSSLLIETRMRIPRCLQGEQRAHAKIAMPIRATVSLLRGARRVDVSITVDNQARDHRLRLRCPSGVISATVKSQGHFGIIERPLRNPASGKNWSQPPPLTFPFREWVAVDNGRRGLAVACRGLYQYEAVRQSNGVTLYITLLRGIARISKNNLKARPGGEATFAIPCPEAQCLGPQSFDYAFLPYSCNTASRAPFIPTANSFLYPPLAHFIQQTSAGTAAELTSPLFTLKPDNLVLSSFKKAEDDNSYILRFWENEGRRTKAVLVLADVFTGVQQVNLNEGLPVALKIKHHQVRLAVAPYKIITLRLAIE